MIHLFPFETQLRRTRHSQDQPLFNDQSGNIAKRLLAAGCGPVFRYMRRSFAIRRERDDIIIRIHHAGVVVSPALRYVPPDE